ncbi:AraC family transcriptional regulator [Ramlibacter sp. AN1015]|uniref:AraC family transcriptional regulator n=1 Tax=Ramlibacter sp. AN1015 TaxID=3133428 RepID=UPI0030BB01C5
MPRSASLLPVPASAATVPMAYAQVVVQAFRQRALDPRQALELAQIAPTQLTDSGAHITPRQMELLSGAAMQALDDEALGAFGRRLPWGSYGMLARASISAPDLGLALRRWCRHHGLLADDLTLRVATGGSSAGIELEEGARHRALPPAAREFSLVHLLRNVHGLASWYIDSRIALQMARFPFAAPPHADTYTHMFPCALEFGAAHAEIVFDARYLALPLRRDERALAQMLQRALPLTVLQYRRDRLLAQQVRQALRSPAAGAAPDAATVAALLNLSARTLHRQLREAGSSLQQLKDEVRCERARELLWRSDKPVKQVAAAAGFRNEKSFIRAFRAWTGTTPAAFRSGRA